MSTIAIKIKGKKVEFRFGFWTYSQLKKKGYRIVDIQETLTEDPFGFVPTLAYVSACAVTMDLSAYEEKDFWQHFEEIGLEHEDTMRLVVGFGESMNQFVNDKGEKKSQPMKTAGK